MATRAHHTLGPWSKVKAELHDLPLAILKKHPARTNPKSAPFNTAANNGQIAALEKRVHQQLKKRR